MPSFVVIAFSVSALISNAVPQTDGEAVRDLQSRAMQAADSGRFVEACTLYSEQVDLLLAQGRQAEAGALYVELGEIRQIQGAFGPAEANYKRSIDLLKRYGGPNDFRLVIGLEDLAWLHVLKGKLGEGSRLMDEARVIAARAQSKDPGLIRHLDMQASYLLVTGRYSEAREDWKRAIEIGRSVYGADPRSYDSVLMHFGQASDIFGDYAGAEQIFREYLDLEKDSSNSSNPSRAVAAGELAHIYTELHKFSEARLWFDESLNLFNASAEETPLVYSMVVTFLADFYMAQGDWSNAQSQYREALNLKQRVLGDNRAVAGSMLSLSRALRKLHVKDEAKQLEDRAKAIFAADRGSAPQQTVDVLALRHE